MRFHPDVLFTVAQCWLLPRLFSPSICLEGTPAPRLVPSIMQVCLFLEAFSISLPYRCKEGSLTTSPPGLTFLGSIL